MSNDRAFENSGFGRSLHGEQKVRMFVVTPMSEEQKKQTFDVKIVETECALPPSVPSPVEQPASNDKNCGCGTVCNRGGIL